MKHYLYFAWVMLMISTNIFAQAHSNQATKEKLFQTPFVHDPVMAVENGITYIYATGAGIDELSSAAKAGTNKANIDNITKHKLIIFLNNLFFIS